MTGAGGKTLTLADKQKIMGKLSLQGTSDVSRLTINGSGSGFILVNGSQPDGSNPVTGQYLSIASDVKIFASDGITSDGVEGTYYTASNSVPASGTSDAYYSTVLITAGESETSRS